MYRNRTTRTRVRITNGAREVASTGLLLVLLCPGLRGTSPLGSHLDINRQEPRNGSSGSIKEEGQRASGNCALI